MVALSEAKGQNPGDECCIDNSRQLSPNNRPVENPVKREESRQHSQHLYFQTVTSEETLQGISPEIDKIEIGQNNRRHGRVKNQYFTSKPNKINTLPPVTAER
jgi:hypothetical protein